MNRFGHPNSSRPAQANIWSTIYSPQILSGQRWDTTRPFPSNMQASRSHANLTDLPIGMENLNLGNRTATSTPAQRYKTASSVSQSMMTPPADASASDPFLSISYPSRSHENSKDKNMYAAAKADDDVFAGNAKPQVDTQAQSVDTSHELAEYSSPAPQEPKPPRSDRLSDPITPQNVQGRIPSRNCVFVANLSMSQSDADLVCSVHDALDIFGPCEVRIRRDQHRHPFAIVAYYDVEHANAALKGSSDIVIDGRKIRTEHAEARRSVVLCRLNNGKIDETTEITEQEVRELFNEHTYGVIEEMSPTTKADFFQHGLPVGLWLKYEYYDDYKDSLKKFNNENDAFRIIDAPKLDQRAPPMAIGPGIGMVEASPSPLNQRNLRNTRSITDQKSIFLGNLPPDVTESELEEIFAGYGTIKGTNIIRKPLTGGLGYNVFAFIEFSSIAEADAAAATEVDLRGQRIRVEEKQYSTRPHVRYNGPPFVPPFTQPISFGRSPRANRWAPPNNAYQPTAQMAQFGFQPMFPDQMMGGMPYYPSYEYVTTPPNSGQRRRAQTGGEYIYGSPPHPAQYYSPAGYQPYGAMAPYQSNEGELYVPPSRRHR